MSLYMNTRRKRTKRTGKFHQVARSGMGPKEPSTHRGWSIELVRRTSGVTVRRTIYNATIHDCNGMRVDYLANFATAGKALSAARDRIDEAIAKREGARF